MGGGDRGDIVLGWLLKLLVSLAIVGVVAFEAGAVLVARVNADTAANEVANEAAFAGRSGDEQAVHDAASAEAAKQKVKLIEATLSDDGKAVTVTVEKRAKTLFLDRISPTRSWTVARVTRSRAVVS